MGAVVIPGPRDGAEDRREMELPGSIAGLARRNAVRLDHESFASDSERLLRAIEHALTSAPAAAVCLYASPPGDGRRADYTDTTSGAENCRQPLARPSSAPRAAKGVGCCSIPPLWAWCSDRALVDCVWAGRIYIGRISSEHTSPSSKSSIGASIGILSFLLLVLGGNLALLHVDIASERRLLREDQAVSDMFATDRVAFAWYHQVA